MVQRCESRYCGKVATTRFPIYDERIGQSIHPYFCCEECARAEMMARHRESYIAHLVIMESDEDVLTRSLTHFH